MNRNEDEELDPEVRHFIIQMKYAPYRKVVREVGKATKKKTKSFVWKSFVKRCLQGFAKIHPDVLRPWRQSVGKSVSHHHGMLAFMQTFGALRKLKQKPRKVGEDHPPNSRLSFNVSMFRIARFKRHANCNHCLLCPRVQS